MDDFATILSAVGIVPDVDTDYTRLGRILMMVLGLYVDLDLLD